jgi:serine/threonine protein kinase
MKKLIKKLLRESIGDGSMSKEEFFKTNNIIEDELDYLGSGDFGKAYSIGDGRVLKITDSTNEFNIAKSLLGKNDVPALDGIVDFYAANIVDGDMMIIMEELTEDSSIEDMYYELNDMLEEQGLPIQYLDNLDTDEYEISEELNEFINAMYDVNHSYRYIGIEASDIKPDNLGVDKNGKIKAFDIDDRQR